MEVDNQNIISYKLSEQYKLFAILEKDKMTLKVLDLQNGNSYINNFDFDEIVKEIRTFGDCDNIQEVFDDFKDKFKESNFSLNIDENNVLLVVNYMRRKKKETVNIKLDKKLNENDTISEKDKEILELKKKLALLEKQLEDKKKESSTPKAEQNTIGKKNDEEKTDTVKEENENNYKKIEMEKIKEEDINRKRILKEKEEKRKKDKEEEQKKYAEIFPNAISCKDKENITRICFVHLEISFKDEIKDLEIYDIFSPIKKGFSFVKNKLTDNTFFVVFPFYKTEHQKKVYFGIRDTSQIAIKTDEINFENNIKIRPKLDKGYEGYELDLQILKLYDYLQIYNVNLEERNSIMKYIKQILEMKINYFNFEYDYMRKFFEYLNDYEIIEFILEIGKG